MAKGSELEKRFAIAFYRWALEDAKREFSQGFPFLSRIRSTTVSDYLDFVRRLSRSERRLFRVAMVKKGHEAAEFLADGKLGDMENELLQRYQNRCIQDDPVLGKVLTLGPAESTRATELSRGSDKYRIDREELRKTLEATLASRVGRVEQRFGSRTSWEYLFPVGPWTIHTAVDTGGRIFQLSYFHRVAIVPHTYLVEFQSILRWLGITGQTNWNMLSPDDIPEAATLLAELALHFIAAVKGMMQALDTATDLG